MALQRLSDLVFTVGSYVRATFGDQFENYVAERGLSYTRGVQVDLPDYRFTGDFSVNGGKIVQLLSANSAEYAAVRSHKVYVDFSEMKLANDARQRLAVLDDSQPFWSDQLLFALRHMADRVLYWTEKNSLEDALTNDGLV